MSTVYLALGSNLGDRRQNLERARALLEPLSGGAIQSASLYETDPLDCPAGSPPYLNSVVSFDTHLSPTELLAETQKIETELGREAVTTRALNAPRPIDLDILLHGSQVLATPDLTLPHPRLHERLFVLYPLRDLAPTLVPLTHANPVAILLELCESPEIAPIQIAEKW